MKKQSLSLTIGIPTYYGGPGLAQTVKSILASKRVRKFRLIISVDANPLKKNIRKELEKLGVEIINNKKRGGQTARIKQIISLCKSDILILTQDDVKFAPNTISKIVKKFEDYSLTTMISIRIVPIKAKTMFERILEVGVSMTQQIGMLWNKTDNYLLANGRCLAFRTKMAKKFTIPDEVVNSDAYLYFENKRLGGRFCHVSDALVFNKSPQTMSEHLKQSKRFQSSCKELSEYLDQDLHIHSTPYPYCSSVAQAKSRTHSTGSTSSLQANSVHASRLSANWRIARRIKCVIPVDINFKREYALPKFIVVRALIEEFIKHPLFTLSYLGILVLTRLKGQSPYINTKRFWETDLSTKRDT